MKRALLTIQFMLMCCCAFASPVSIENIERYGFWCLGPCIVLVLYHILRDTIGYRVPPWSPFKAHKQGNEETRGEQTAMGVTNAPQTGTGQVDWYVDDKGNVHSRLDDLVKINALDNIMV